MLTNYFAILTPDQPHQYIDALTDPVRLRALTANMREEAKHFRCE